MLRTRLSVLAVCLAAALFAAEPIRLNPQQYFEAPGFSFLPYQNDYRGLQGGLQMIQNGERLLDSGDVYFDPPAGAVRFLRRTVDAAANTATVEGEVSGVTGYRLITRTDGSKIIVTLKLDKVPANTRAGLRIALYSGAFYGKSYQGESASGVFPRQFTGNPMLISASRRIRVAQESPAVSIAFARTDGPLSLTDNRRSSPQPWFSLSAPLEAGASEVTVEITPTILEGWVKPPVIGVSQVGYAPAQPKRAIIELDPKASIETARLWRLTLNGEKTVAKSGTPKAWGRFLRSQYAVFDFSDVREPGLYAFEYGTRTVGPFRIAADVYDLAWQPAITYFLPVQMCHVAVREGSRTWHGACHLDDARQAPANKRYIDGYVQAEHETPFADDERVPGLDWGGWHDAGDHDLPAGSIASTTQALAFAQEEFAPSIDDYTIRRASREVALHVPDGKSDLLEQIEFGAESLVLNYKVAGHILPGIIERTGRQYGHLGDPANVTDNRPCADPAKECDDRWVFTNRNTGLQYQVAQSLALASRVLRGYNDTLAADSLKTAQALFDDEQSKPPVYAPNAYVPRDSGHRTQEIAAAAELLLTTGDAKYRARLVELAPVIQSMPVNVFGAGPGFILVRALDRIGDANLHALIVEKARAFQKEQAALIASSPYGVPWPAYVGKFEGAHTDHPWGLGWEFQSAAMRHYFFAKHLPDIFDSGLVYAVTDFVLGVHPASNESYVSGVGANSPLAAYGTNRADWSHIPGGVISGASLIRPDFMELKEFPFLYYQTEYVIHGAATYLFDLLAAQKAGTAKGK